MISLNDEQFEQFEEIAQFLLTISNIDFDVSYKTGYYIELGKLIDMTFKSVKNSLIGKQEISENAVKYFGKKFDETITKHAKHENKSLIEKYQKQLKEWSQQLLVDSLPQRQSKANPTLPISQNILKAFSGTKWYCYERLINQVGRKVITFGQFNRNEFSVLIEYKDVPIWEGWGKYNQVDDLICFTADHKDSSDYTHFIFKVDKNEKNLQLCIGHASYKHRKNLNIVTKAVVLTEVKKTEWPKISPAIFDFGNKTIPPAINEFFKNRILNRLSSPHKIDTPTLGALQKWIDQNKPKSSFLNNPILGKYKVYTKRKPSEKQYFTGSCEIYEEGGQLKIKGSYEISPKEFVHLEADAKIHSDTRTLLAMPTENQNTANTSANILDSTFAFLILSLPVSTIKNIDTLVGIATAPREQNLGLVSRMLVFVKQVNGKAPQTFNKTELDNFFHYYRNQSWIRPPKGRKVPCISQFSHLKEAVSESKKNYGDDISF